jgi:aspartate kinase/aspartokinase/homoserine dehydrogenase 1
MYIENTKIREEIVKKIRKRIGQLGKYLLGIHCLGGMPDFAKDMVLSYGERLSSLLLESILNFRGIACKEVLPEFIGLSTDGEFGNATVDYEKSEENIRKKLDKSTIYVVPGFYGMSSDDKVTLLGRGGTDYSAAAIGRCVKASSVDIWKDVSGFMSADPKLVKNPIVIKRLSYREAAELSYFGAQILHPRTFEPVMDENIPIRLFDINHFSNCPVPLSVIESESDIKEDVIKSVTYTNDISVLKLRGPGVGIKPGILSKLTTTLSREKINIKSVITSQTSINLFLSRGDLEKSYQLVQDIGLHVLDEVIRVKDISLIAVVGEGMLHQHGIAARVFTAVSKHRINMEIIAAGASVVATYFIVSEKECGKAVNSIHREFFE